MSLNESTLLFSGSHKMHVDVKVLTVTNSDVHLHNLTRFQNLTALDVSHNKLQKLQGLTSLPWLVSLNLSHNNISRIPQFIFVGFFNLRFIYLQGNSLSILSKNTFYGLPVYILTLLIYQIMYCTHWEVTHLQGLSF